MSSEAITRNDLEAILNEIFNPLPLIDLYYPVGSYYETSDTTFNPNVSWGGTWQLDSAGKVTVAYDSSDADFDTVGDTGGDKTAPTNDHQLTTTEIPAHTHGSKTITYAFRTRRLTDNYQSIWGVTNATVAQDSTQVSSVGGGTAGKYTDKTTLSASHTHDNVGGNGSHNHGSVSTIQPYVVVNRWHRTA